MSEMLGRVRLKENSGSVQMDEELPSLLEIVFKFLANNLEIVCERNPITEHLELRDGIVIPNEICDRFVYLIIVVFNLLLFSICITIKSL